MHLPDCHLEPYIIDNTVVTLIFLAALFVIRWLIVQMIRNPRINGTPEQRLRWCNYTRTAFVILGAFGVIYIWAEQVHNLALSLIAMGLAVVVATKEILLCVNGSLLRIRSNAYSIGDRIEVNGIRGDVVDINVLSTTLMEVGPKLTSQQQTGRCVTIPNSLLLTYPLINESLIENFIIHNITIPLPLGSDWKRAKAILLKVAQAECSSFLKKAQRQIRDAEQKLGIHIPSLEPHVWIHLPHHEALHLILQITTPASLRGGVEQAILTQFLSEFMNPPPAAVV